MHGYPCYAFIWWCYLHLMGDHITIEYSNYIFFLQTNFQERVGQVPKDFWCFHNSQKILFKYYIFPNGHSATVCGLGHNNRYTLDLLFSNTIELKR